MKVLNHKFILASSILALLFPTTAFSELNFNTSLGGENQFSIETNKDTKNKKTADKNLKTKEQQLQYLQDNPEELEKLLLLLLSQGNEESLAELLPVYQKYKKHDPSIIDWGNALIKAKKGDLDNAIKDYRQLSTKLPQARFIRFQLAMTLFFNHQYQASKHEFEKLRASSTDKEEKTAINNYLNAINKNSAWDLSATVNYLNDKNLTNAPKVGTEMGGVTYTSPHQSGKGLSYDFTANRKFLQDNGFFLNTNINAFGKYYWNNKNYSDVNLQVAEGLGYQTDRTTVELTPYISKRWYAGGSGSDGNLEEYSQSYGITTGVKQWISPKLRYQGQVTLSKNKYEQEQSENDSKDISISNNLLYFSQPDQYYIVGYNHAKRKSNTPAESYKRNGINLGWNQQWNDGFVTHMNVGYARRNYEKEDFLSGLKRENKEYNLGMSLWNRKLSFLSLTPRLQWDYSGVKSNSAFEEYDKNNVSIQLSKTF